VIILELAALFIVIISFKIFGIYGIAGLLLLLLIWQLDYRVKNGHWMEGIDH